MTLDKLDAVNNYIISMFGAYKGNADALQV